MRIAIAHWQGRISPVFDAAGNLMLVDVEDGREVQREERKLEGPHPLARAAEVAAMGVDILICGAISAPVEARLASSGVRVAGFICGAVQQVLEAFLRGGLANREFAMPGCHGRRYGGGRGKGAGRRGGGWRAGFPSQAPADYGPESEMEALKRQAEFLERSLDQVRRRLEERETKPEGE